MNRRKFFIVLFVFTVMISLYYFGVKPLLSGGEKPFYLKDDFSGLNTDFWYVGSMESNGDIKGKVDIHDGVLKLQKTPEGENLYLLSKPLKMGKKQVLTVKRKLSIHPTGGYFSGGFVLFQTNSNSRLISSDEKFPYGSAIFMLEYVKDPTGKTTRPGKNNFRILPKNWEEDGNALLMPPVFEKEFEEQITYNAYNGRIDYSIGDRKESIQGEALAGAYIRIWMHAYGVSAKQRMDLSNIEIKIANIENMDMEK